MVSANVQRIGNEFDDMVEDRDIMGFVALAGVGAIGGVLAEMFQDRLAPRLNQPTEPTNATGLVGSFGMKAAMALIFALVSTRLDGTGKMVAGVLGVGAAVDAGVDLIEAGDSLRGGMTSSQPAMNTQSTPTKTTYNGGGSGNATPVATNTNRASTDGGTSGEYSAVN
jgi:hypothetical protein